MAQRVQKNQHVKTIGGGQHLRQVVSPPQFSGAGYLTQRVSSPVQSLMPVQIQGNHTSCHLMTPPIQQRLAKTTHQRKRLPIKNDLYSSGDYSPQDNLPHFQTTSGMMEFLSTGTNTVVTTQQSEALHFQNYVIRGKVSGTQLNQHLSGSMLNSQRQDSKFNLETLKTRLLSKLHQRRRFQGLPQRIGSPPKQQQKVAPLPEQEVLPIEENGTAVKFEHERVDVKNPIHYSHYDTLMSVKLQQKVLGQNGVHIDDSRAERTLVPKAMRQIEREEGSLSPKIEIEVDNRPYIDYKNAFKNRFRVKKSQSPNKSPVNQKEKDYLYITEPLGIFATNHSPLSSPSPKKQSPRSSPLNGKLNGFNLRARASAKRIQNVIQAAGVGTDRVNLIREFRLRGTTKREIIKSIS
ncbi:hypothetical protein FGO68_gene12792 [Halteria grandinella]|uniref:Uncharacterized protein n=1 Tax=Halteria grandinella TaxID=5974 RepID=A0A8J8ND99_HALGN|nr:hypothetical protein FGO68_gene12792 [Halteria grandinella]